MQRLSTREHHLEPTCAETQQPPGEPVKADMHGSTFSSQASNLLLAKIHRTHPRTPSAFTNQFSLLNTRASQSASTKSSCQHYFPYELRKGQGHPPGIARACRASKVLLGDTHCRLTEIFAGTQKLVCSRVRLGLVWKPSSPSHHRKIQEELAEKPRSWKRLQWL